VKNLAQGGLNEASVKAGARIQSDGYPVPMRMTKVAENFDAVLFLAVALTGVYSMMTNSGLYSWLAEWQFRFFHSHFPVLTALLSMLPLVAVAVGVSKMAGRFAAAFDASRNTQRTERPFSQARMLVYMGLFTAIGGAWSGWIAFQRSTEVWQYETLDLSNPKVVAGRHVALTGIDQTQLAVTLTLGDSKETFTPVTGPDWRPGFKIAYVAKGPSFLLAAPNPPFGTTEPNTRPVTGQTRKGILVPNGLPSEARAAFETAGVGLHSPVMLLDPSPFSETLPYLLAALGAIFTPFFLVVALFVHRKNR
jgi:hypothetical protein